MSFVGTVCNVPDQANHAMTAGGQQRRQRGPDQPGGTGDGDGERWHASFGGVSVRGQVVVQLAVTVDERRTQCRRRNGRFDAVVDTGRTQSLGAEPVGVAPLADDAGRPRPHPARGELVDEAMRRVVVGALVLRYPSQPGGQPQHRSSIAQRVRLGHHRHRLPWRDQPGHRPRPGVPGEHLAQRMVDHALVFDAHEVHS
jgi:hypothetical protein